MIREVHYIMDGKLCDCPLPGRVSTGLRLANGEPELWIRCNGCGAEVSHPSRKLKSMLFMEVK